MPAFTTQCNARVAQPAADTLPAWRPLPATVDLARVCSVYTEATVLNDNTVRVAGTVLQIPPGPHPRGYAKARVEVRHGLDGTWRVYYHDPLIATTVTSLGPPTASLKRRKYPQGRRHGDIFMEQLR